MQIARLFQDHSNRSLLSRAGLERLDAPGEAAGKELYILSSDASLYACLRLQEVPASLRESYVAQRVHQLSPFENTASYFLLEGDSAQLWLWDAELEPEDGNARARTVPEMLMLPSVRSGLIVRAGKPGDERHRFQLEYWHQGVLQALQPCLTEPEQRTLAEFALAQGVPGDQDWLSAGFDYLAAPRDQDTPFSRGWFLQPAVTLGLSLLISGLLVAGFLGSFLGWNLAVGAKQAQLEEMTEAARPLLEQRSAALGLDARSEALAVYFRYEPVIEIAAEFERVLGPYYDELVEWNYDRGTLSAILIDRGGNSRRHIETLSGSSLFTDVKSNPGIRPDSVELEMQVVPFRNELAVD